MSFQAGIDQAVPSQGNLTQLVIGEKTGFKGPALTDLSSPIRIAADGSKTGGDFARYQPLLSGVDLAFQGSLIESGVFTGSRARAAGFPGRLGGVGGFVAGGSPLVIPLLLRNLMQDKNPSYHILGGSGQTLPAVVGVVNNQPLAGATPKTIADDLASTTNVVQLTVSPNASAVKETDVEYGTVEVTGTDNNDDTIDRTLYFPDGVVEIVNAKNLKSETEVVDAGDIDTTDALTIANDLSIFDTARALTVTPSAAPASPKTITIVGTDNDGTAQTVTLTFNSAAAQTTTQVWKTVESVAVDAAWGVAATLDVTFPEGLLDLEALNLSGFADYRLVVTPSSTATLTTPAQNATVVIKGIDNEGEARTDTLTFTDANKTVAQVTTERFALVTTVMTTNWDVGTLTLINFTDDLAQTTDNFFKTITAVKTTGWSAGDVNITAQDKAVRLTIRAQDQKPVCYLFGEITRGVVAAIIDDMLITQITIAITPEELMRLACVTIYREELEYQNIAGLKGANAKASDTSALEYPSEDFFIGWQVVFYIDGIKVPANSVTLVINQNWGPVGGLSGKQTNESNPVAAQREVNMSGDFIYEARNNINQDFIKNRRFSNLELRAENALEGAFPAMVRMMAAKGQLAANPTPTYSGDDLLTQAYEIRCLPVKVGSTNDIRWILDVPNYERFRIYS